MEDKKKEFMKTLGNNIRMYREQKGLSQEELANRCGWTTNNARSTISKIESGVNDVPTSKVKVIAEQLGVSVCDLMNSSANVQTKDKIRKLIEQCYGKEVYETLSSLLDLDASDQKVIKTMIDSMLSAEKYSVKKESLNA
ncbi:helix-turn-helix domain-containing protein [Lachnoclostridium pacaense]|uniref:helix-turn-helix domain-containing protein n=1 Tax=Enterocloster hominis (ex Hitch et al. 2024) TaxID=1917870 RepID=UPI001D10F747|nr:helix-turn-helix transcriptional regulator [Lachnoclostridium pacaense]MCC2821050.1 helix-turn-helix domain-containing protein [Lachnoclostridium pacaense]